MQHFTYLDPLIITTKYKFHVAAMLFYIPKGIPYQKFHIYQIY